MNQSSKKELMARIQELEDEKAELLSLYLTASSLFRETNNYIATLWDANADLKDELIVLKQSKKINFNVQEEFAKIKTELRELEEKKGKSSDEENF